MIIGKFKPVTKANVPQMEDWLEKVTDPIVDQIKDLTMALQNQLSFNDNLNAEVREFGITHDAWTQIELKTLRGVPIGCFLLWTAQDDYTQFRWKLIDINKVAIKVKFGTDPATVTKVRVVVMGK
jgi:hypothetical protein